MKVIQKDKIMTNTGIEYELFVQNLMQAILNSENQGGQKNIKVRHNEKIADVFGVERQFDVLWEYELGGIVYNTVIECKDYNSPISIEIIDALIGKLKDYPNFRGIIATTKGYQSGAKEKAKNNGIELLCVRKSDDSDWVNEKGQPLVRKISLNITICPSPVIIKCKTFLDKKYLDENNIDIEQINISDPLNTEVFIEDKTKNEKYSLYELQQKIANKNDDYGLHEKDIEFEDAYIVKQNIRLKLKKLHIIYSIAQPCTETITIDGADYILGVVEYLNQGKKKTVFNTPYEGTQVKNEALPNKSLEKNS